MGAHANDRPTTWLARAVVVIGALNVVVLLAQARETIHQLDLNGDFTMSLVLPALAGHAPPGSVITLGNHAYYEAWWFERATIGLPDFRAIWEGAPFVVEAVGIALVAWCAWVVLGRLAGLLCAVTLVSVSDGLRAIVAMNGGRVGLTVHAGALCAALLIVSGASRAPRLSRRALAAFTVFTVIFGAAAATDQLVALTVVAPYMLAPCLWFWYDRTDRSRGVAIYALATGAAALVGAVLLTAIMHSEHVVHSPYPVMFATVDSLASNLQNLLGSWTVLGDGLFFGMNASGVALTTFALGLLSLAGLAAVVWALSRRAYVLLANARQEPAVRSDRFLFMSFWGLVLATDLAIFLGTQVSDNVIGGSHYLLSAWVAVAVLLGAFAQSMRLRVTLLIGVGLFALFTLREHVVDGVSAFGTGPSQAASEGIANFASAHGARIGYAEYLDAPTITWDTALKAQVYPIGPCGTGTSGLCPFFIGTSSWYIPRRHVWTFLLTDSRPAATGGSIVAAPAALGKPAATGEFGPFTVFVYRYDIASTLGPEE